MKILILAIALVSALTAAELNLKSCTACHGVDWSKKALNKSKVVSDMNETEIATALKGYKDGSYGGAMKGLMKGQIAKYTEEQIEEIAKQIKK